jgi:hypothetical protein
MNAQRAAVERIAYCWAMTQAAGDTFSRLNYCIIFTVYTQYTNVATGRVIQGGGPPAGDQRPQSISVHSPIRDKKASGVLRCVNITFFLTFTL